jgi:hypothetical protein
MNDQNTIVQVKLSDYKELEAMANRTTAEVKLLAKKELKLIQEKGAANIMLRLHSKEWSDETLFLSVNSYDDLSPQLRFIAYKIQNWAYEELAEVHGEYNKSNRLQREILEYRKHIDKLTSILVLGWFLAIVFAVCFIIKVW